MAISPLTTIRCLIMGHRFETHLVRCNGSHFICRKCGMHIWRSVTLNDGDVIREFRESQSMANNQLPGVPTPEQLCMFVAENYGCYQGSYLCGKASEILSYLLWMAGYRAEKVAVTINGIGHIFVQCNGLNLDPTIKQFGDYPEISKHYPLHVTRKEISPWKGANQ